jgi:hypothetical protein
MGKKSAEWSKSIALGSRAKGRHVVEGGQGYQLREAAADYKLFLEDEKEGIGSGNAYFWYLNG